MAREAGATVPRTLSDHGQADSGPEIRGRRPLAEGRFSVAGPGSRSPVRVWRRERKPVMNAGSEGSLDGLRVVELASGVSGPYCGKLLADLGAEVIKVESPRVGDPMRAVGPFLGDEPGLDRGLFFNFLNTNKLGVTLDVCTSTGHEWLLALLAGADVFLFGGDTSEIERQGLGFEVLRPDLPDLTGVYVTPFGLTGPYAGFRGGELIAFQMSALGVLTPGGNDDLTRPPLKPGGYHAQMVAGVSAATATMHALFAREADGTGGRLVDVAELEAIASFQFMNMARWVYAGDRGARPRATPGQRIRCRDGQVVVMFSQDHQWRSWVEMMESPGWATDPRFGTRAGRMERIDEIVAQIDAWAADHTVEELYRAGQARRVPIFPLNTIASAVESPQVQSRPFLQEIPLASGESVRAPTAPYTWSKTPWRLRRAAPRLGEHNQETFGDRLGMSPGDLAAAYESGVM